MQLGIKVSEDNAERKILMVWSLKLVMEKLKADVDHESIKYSNKCKQIVQIQSKVKQRPFIQDQKNLVQYGTQI